MNKEPITVLLVEDDPHDAQQIRDALAAVSEWGFSVEYVTRLDEALIRLGETSVGVVLLDLTLPDCQGVAAFERVREAAPTAMILVLVATAEEGKALLAAQQGAEDYVVKAHADSHWLPRALHYLTERRAAVTALRSVEEALFEERERAEVTLDSIGDAVLCTDMQGHVTYLNMMAETMTGWSRKAAYGQPLAEVFNLLDGASHVPATNPALRAIDQNRTVGLAMNSVLIRRDGAEYAIEDSAAPIHNRNGQVVGAVLVFRDVSVSRAMTEQMTHLAQHDFLTGLPNRLLLTERLSQAIGQARRHDKQVALFFLDLDYFKHVNDSLGHEIGDELLRSVAERLLECVRATDTVCRQGGDEFVILLPEIEQPQDAAHIAEKLITAFAAPHLIDGHELHVSLSIGVSIFPDDGSDADALMRNADTAMYHAKSFGRNNFQFFREEMNSSAVKRLFIESGLRRALREGEFLLHFQPKINLASGVMTGCEALIRWLDPERGMIFPNQFIQVAEECRLIVPIGRWVLREACRQIRAWQDAGLKTVPVAINVSAVEFRHPDFLEGVDLILEETGIAPGYLELEITESILMHDAESSAELLVALRKRGVHISIDDFGTGYSSLSYLKRFATDTLKIDKSFVHDISDSKGGSTIVGAVICMGKNLKQRIVAEGVETVEQLAYLRKQRCDEGQGFHFSYPLSADSFALLLADGGELRLPVTSGV